MIKTGAWFSHDCLVSLRVSMCHTSACLHADTHFCCGWFHVLCIHVSSQQGHSGTGGRAGRSPVQLWAIWQSRLEPWTLHSGPALHRAGFQDGLVWVFRGERSWEAQLLSSAECCEPCHPFPLSPLPRPTPPTLVFI